MKIPKPSDEDKAYFVSIVPEATDVESPQPRVANPPNAWPRREAVHAPLLARQHLHELLRVRIRVGITRHLQPHGCR